MDTLSKEILDAAHKGDVNAIGELSGAGQNLNGICEEDGSDLLYHFIWQNCDTERLRMLISLGCMPQNKSTTGGTPLIAAIWCKCPEMVRILIEAGADPNTIAFLGDDEYSALDSIIDEYSGCDSDQEFDKLMQIEKLVREAGGRVKSKSQKSGCFPDFMYE